MCGKRLSAVCCLLSVSSGLVVVLSVLHRHPTFLPVKIFTVNLIMDLPPLLKVFKNVDFNLKRFYGIFYLNS
jgi:hypothetical protein